MLDFGWSIVKSSMIEDDLTPIRSRADDVKLRQITISNVSFTMEHVNEVKTRLGVVGEISQIRIFKLFLP
jgi:hypothetical protein